MSGAPKAKIAIAIATHDYVPAQFMYDLASMVMYTTARLPDDVEFGINMVSGTYVHSARQELLEALVEQGVTHMLWLDSDMRFPRDSLIRLLKHNVPLVGINYSTRQIPPRYVAIKRMGTDERVGENLVTGPDSTGLEEVDALGFGMVLMKMHPYVDAMFADRKPEDPPFFFFEWLPKRKIQKGEDVMFCEAWRKAGGVVYVDHDLSKECAHVGSFEYRIGHVNAWQELAAREAAEGGD